MMRNAYAQGLLAVVLAILSCGVSLVLTIRLCQELRGGDEEWLTMAIGGTWELGKCFFAAVGVALVASGRGLARLGGFLVCLLAAVLVVGSVAASLAYMVELDGDSQAAAELQDARQKDITVRLAVLDEQMSTLATLAADDQQRQYRRRALASLTALDELRQQRTALTAELTELLQRRLLPGNGAPALAGVARLMGWDAARARAARLELWVYGILSMALELVGIAAIAIARYSFRDRCREWEGSTSPVATTTAVASGCPSPKSPNEAPGTSTKSPISPNGPAAASTTSPISPNGLVAASTTSPISPNSGRGESPISPNAGDEVSPNGGQCSGVPSTVAGSDRAGDEDAELASRYAAARDLILNGELRPTYRNLRSRLQLGQEMARVIMRALVDDGVVVKRGRRYVGRRDGGVSCTASDGTGGLAFAAAEEA